MSEVELYDIRQIAGKDVTILKLKGNTTKDTWFCAYARIDNLKNEEYHYETYREGNVLGIDTAHGWNTDQNLDDKLKDAIYQIGSLIEEAKEPEDDKI